MQEHVSRQGNLLRLLRSPDRDHVRRQGSDVRKGEVLLGPGELAVLAAAGHGQPLVRPRPTVAHIVTGDELVGSGEVPGPWQVRDSNGSLVVTTGGTGPAPRDVTPEATRAVIEKELPGFGEIMRTRSFDATPTAILSRATAGIRGRSLVVNLLGSPKAVRECIAIIMPAIVEALRHLAKDRPSSHGGTEPITAYDKI